MHAKLGTPALPVPVPLLPCAMPMFLPSSSTTAPVPSLPPPSRFCVCFFFLCASSSHCSSPSQLLLLSSLCPNPAHVLRAAMTAKSTGSCRCGSKPSPGSSGTTWALLLYQCFLSSKKLLWRLLFPLLWLGGFKDVLHHWEHQVVHPLSASSGLALPLPAAPCGADPLLAAAGQGMPSPTGPALTLPFTHF